MIHFQFVSEDDPESLFELDLELDEDDELLSSELSDESESESDESESSLLSSLSSLLPLELCFFFFGVGSNFTFLGFFFSFISVIFLFSVFVRESRCTNLRLPVHSYDQCPNLTEKSLKYLV